MGVIGTAVLAVVAAGAAKFSPGTVTVGGEIGRRMSVAAEKILRHTDVDGVFVRPFREHASGTYGGFVGYGMLLDAVVQAAAHGVGGEEMVAFKRRRLAEIAATAMPDGRISMYRDKPGFWDNHEQAYLIQAFCRDYRHFGCTNSLRAAMALGDFLVRTHQPMTLGTESAFMALWNATGEARYRTYLEKDCRIRGDIADYERHLGVNGVGHVYTWLARALGQVEYGAAFGCPHGQRRLAADEAVRRLFSPMLSVSGTCTGCGGQMSWGETWGDSQIGLGKWGETCASAYLLRLTGALMAQGDEVVARYGDLMERTLYNGFLAAQSEDGLKYRYWSPFNEMADWYPRDTYCCPNNFRRMVFEIPDLVYFRAADGLYVNLYAPSELKADGLHVVQRTGYPADGRVAFEFDFARSQRVRFRIPGWTGSSEGWRQVEFPSGRSRYELDFEMRPRLIRGVRAQAGNAALMIGPVVYGLRNDSRVPSFHHWCEAGGFAPDQPFALSNGVVRVTLEKSYVPGIVRERRTFDFVPFCASDRVRTYFRADSRQKLVDDGLYADWAREVLKCGKTGGAK